MVCHAGWKKPLGANLRSGISTFGTANTQFDRLKRCYALREATAPKELLIAIVGAMFESNGTPPDLEKKLIAATRGKPTVVAVHSIEKTAIFEHCQQLDCEMGPHSKPKFVRFEEHEELQLLAADGTSTRALYVPGEQTTSTLTLLDDGATPDLVAEAKAGHWPQAAELAAKRVADTRGHGDLLYGIALANLALVQTFTGDRDGARATVASFRALKLSTGRADVAAATTTVAQADEWATGMMYLGPDPCAPAKRR